MLLITRSLTSIIFLSFSSLGFAYVQPDDNLLPLSPANKYPIEMISGLVQGAVTPNTPKGKFLLPYIPPLRVTQDGRIGLSTESKSGALRFYLIRPETLKADGKSSIYELNSNADQRIYSNHYPLNVSDVIAKLKTENGQNIPSLMGGITPQHTTICDPTSFHLKNQEHFPLSNGNPVRCSASSQNDCYKISLVGRLHVGSEINNKSLRFYKVNV